MPGRVFSARGWPGAPDIKVGHVCDCLCIEPAHDAAAARAMLEPAIQAALGPVAVSTEVGEKDLGEDSPIYHTMTLSVRHNGESFGVCRGGLLTERLLQEAGFDPKAVGGSHFGFGLDRLVMCKLGTCDIRRLWQPPYVA